MNKKEILYPELARTIRKLRAENSMTQKQFADKFEVTQASVSLYENGMRMPEHKLLERIAKEFNVTISYLLGETQPTTPTLYKNPNPRYAPLLGTASAGTPESVDQFIDEMIEIPNFIKHEADHMFFIKVNGDSMNKLMGNGSTALILKSEHFTTQPKTGDIVVFKVDGEYCIKRFIETDTVVIFEPASYSDEFKPLVYVKGTSIDIEVIGKVIYTYNTWE
ncbi:MAG: LexA family protein, partial [Culicoidibacterales bacterium]